MSNDRDRDPAGRARQARPRDALGRPLPYGAAGVEPVSEEPLPPEETIAAARSLVAQGRPFSAHEVLEARWKAAPEQERDLWQGLAQICVGLTHALRGNDVGAAGSSSAAAAGWRSTPGRAARRTAWTSRPSSGPARRTGSTQDTDRAAAPASSSAAAHDVLGRASTVRARAARRPWPARGRDPWRSAPATARPRRRGRPTRWTRPPPGPPRAARGLGRRRCSR